ncbi:nucleobase:cation symporter-1, NCS1 family [Peptoclostridium litorale DSM 5388]|uniref:Putative allantoin permease PucI n=1 Tax=Peptoclostridium litorale DSM 5388 TaxID=1121324 RepID=A0A069RGZ1_PEPLI|nr:NCS1 family transporter [Peptoclostridium litorale]KDR96304.1 putative allantoin permease PucI [Peptoclostridium litorale DSM 5388]SIO26046.1 nucleobase:cation symporter-1, NCS1 family [Peptoclostridium litorale DSM 5388]
MINTVDEMKIDSRLLKNTKSELLPTNERIMDKISYLCAFLGGCVSIGTFSMGASLIGILNFTQAIVAMAIGCTVIAIALVFAGKGGHKYGIPFTVQARGVFGIKGVAVPGLLRAIPAIVWFGFQSWVGAGALNSCFKTIWGFDNMMMCFILFTALQVALAIKGFKGIKWVENIGSVFILLTLGYMFYSVLTKYNAEISSTIMGIEGTWGLPFWGGTTAFLGIYSTMIINSSDYSRELKRETKSLMTGSLYWLAILPATLFMGLIGLMVSGATGNADPIAVFSSAVDNQFLTIMTLVFIAFAQVTTNILNNIVPPVYVLMDNFKISYKKATILVGILSLLTFPWILVRPESAGGLALFTQIYSAFLGPIFAVLVVDYFILRKQKLNLNHYYDIEGPFNGVNWAGIISIFTGAAVALMFVQVSWYVSLVPSGLVYYVLMGRMKSSRPYARGTIFEGNDNSGVSGRAASSTGA